MLELFEPLLHVNPVLGVALIVAESPEQKLADPLLKLSVGAVGFVFTTTSVFVDVELQLLIVGISNREASISSNCNA
jgi:hypothetical protein